MDQDFYIEETSPAKVIFTVIFFVLLIAGGIYAYLHYNQVKIKLKNITVELGDKLSTDIKDYIVTKDYNSYELDLSNVNVDEDGKTISTGEYSYKVIKGSETKRGKIFVKDSTKPIVTVQDLTVGVNEEFEPYEFVVKCEDLSIPCDTKYKKSSDSTLNTKAGTYNIIIIVSDNEGNEVEKEVKLTVSTSETLESKKVNDLSYSYTSLNNDEWDKTYTLKLSKAVNPESSDYEKTVSEISQYEYTYEKAITKQEIIAIYNKYDYVIGYSVMITFDDNTKIFASSDKIKVEEDTEEEQ